MSIEMSLYIDLKKYLKSAQWELIGGQPPSGTDHLPVLELKSHIGEVKGSASSYKPDLVAYKTGRLLLVEIKPKYSPADNAKLLNILEEPTRLETLWAELRSRQIHSSTDGLIANRRTDVQVELALCHEGNRPQTSTVWTLCRDENGDFHEFSPV